MVVASFTTGALLTILIPVALLIVTGVYWLLVTRSDDEF
jgi:hypothetical protein